MLYLFLDNICHHPALVALLCNLCGCADFLRTYCGGSNMSASPGIVPIQNFPLTEVSLLGLYYIVLVCSVRCAGWAVVGSPLGSHLTSPLLGHLCLCVMEQGFYIQSSFLQIFEWMLQTPVFLDHLYTDLWKLKALHQYLDQSLVLLSESHCQYSYAGWNGGVVAVFPPICYKCYLYGNPKLWGMSAGDLSIRELPYKEFIIFNLKLKDHQLQVHSFIKSNFP